VFAACAAGVDPGHETLVALRWLAGLEAPLLSLLMEAAPVPDELEVVGEVERIEVLVRAAEKTATEPLSPSARMVRCRTATGAAVFCESVATRCS